MYFLSKPAGVFLSSCSLLMPRSANARTRGSRCLGMALTGLTAGGEGRRLLVVQLFAILSRFVGCDVSSHLGPTLVNARNGLIGPPFLDQGMDSLSISIRPIIDPNQPPGFYVRLVSPSLEGAGSPGLLLRGQDSSFKATIRTHTFDTNVEMKIHPAEFEFRSYRHLDDAYLDRDDLSLPDPQLLLLHDAIASVMNAKGQAGTAGILSTDEEDEDLGRDGAVGGAGGGLGGAGAKLAPGPRPHALLPLPIMIVGFQRHPKKP